MTNPIKLTPIDISSIREVASIDDLFSSDQVAKFSVGDQLAFARPGVSTVTEQHIFSIPNARLLVAHLVCLVITPDDRYFPVSFPKPWPYARFRDGDSDDLLVPIAADEIEHIEGTWVSPFTFPDVSHLYHSLIDNYGRLSWLEGYGGDYEVLFPYYEQPTGIAAELFDLFLGRKNVGKIPEGIYRVDRIVLPPAGNRDEQMFTTTVDFLRTTIAREFALRDHTHAARIYVSRADTRVRNLVNEAELIEALRPLGFTAICPGEYSFRAQMEMFSAAEIIVGIHGMGLMPMLAASRCRKVVEIEALGWPETAFSSLSGAMGIDYRKIGAEIVPDDVDADFHWLGRVDIDEVLDAIGADVPEPAQV